jgi:hypothetical protein
MLSVSGWRSGRTRPRKRTAEPGSKLAGGDGGDEPVETETNLAQRPIDELVVALCRTIAAQRAQIKSLEELTCSRGDDAVSYRFLAQQSLHALHAEQQAHTRLRDQYKRLISEYRELRARVTEKAAA